METIMTKQRPILFSAPMVRALLAGTKTQTRRIVKPQPLFCEHPSWSYISPTDPVLGEGLGHRTGWYVCEEELPEEGSEFYRCPYGVVGDRLWVRETVAIEHWTREFGDEPPLPKDRPWKHCKIEHPDGDDERWFFPHYRATDPAPDLGCERDNCRTCEAGDPGPHWIPSIHMPRWASRLTLEITDVRVQRLQDISTEDVLAEGVEIPRSPDGFPLVRLSGKNPPTRWLDLATAADPKAVVRAYYASLWCDINGADSWDLNPWVWAITFKTDPQGAAP